MTVKYKTLSLTIAAAGASVIEQQAALLAPQAWSAANVVGASTVNFSSKYGRSPFVAIDSSTPNGRNIFDWAGKAHYDPVRRKVWFVGGGINNGGNESQTMTATSYDIASNTFTPYQGTILSGDGLWYPKAESHSFGASDIDLVRRKIYRSIIGSTRSPGCVIGEFDLDNPVDTGNVTFPAPFARTDTYGFTVVFPGRTAPGGAGVGLVQRSFGSTINVWDLATRVTLSNITAPDTGVPNGIYGGLAIYHKASGATTGNVYFSGAHTSTQFYRLGPTGNPTQIGTLPISMTNGQGTSSYCLWATLGDYLYAFHMNGRIYRVSLATGSSFTWENYAAIPTTLRPSWTPVGSDGGAIHEAGIAAVPLSTNPCFLWIAAMDGYPVRSYLWNPAPAPTTTTYVATHYVAPFASVTGATSDYGVTGRSFAQATSPSTPCTLGTAMAAAVAGNKVRCAPGVYVGIDSQSTWVGSFQPANSGASGNPIVFFAQNPAAYNLGQTALYSEVRRTAVGVSQRGPILNASAGSSYQIFDGFYANEAQSRCGFNAGLFQLHDTTGSEFRRCLIDRDPTFVPVSGGNECPMYHDSAWNCRIVDCYFRGRYSSSVSLLIPLMEIYGANGTVIENCTFENTRTPFFFKSNSLSVQTISTLRNCKFINCDIGIWHQTNQLVTIHNNLVIANELPLYFQNHNSTLSVANIYNNTFIRRGVATGVNFDAGNQIRANVNYDGSSWTDNIWQLNSGTPSQVPFWDREPPQPYTNWADVTLNRNHYHDENGTPTWRDVSNQSNSLGEWRTRTGQEAASTEGAVLFVDAAAGNYRLQAGSPARSGVGGRTTTAGCYITGTEEIGVRANPTY